jgi:hypothetical protein
MVGDFFGGIGKFTVSRGERAIPAGVRYMTPEAWDHPVPLPPVIDTRLMPTAEDYIVDLEADALDDPGDETFMYGRLAPRAPWELLP